MINVSNAFKERMRTNTRFIPHAVITLTDETVLTPTEADFAMGGNSLVDGAGSNGLPLGNAVERIAKIELMNYDERYDEISFLGASVQLSLSFDLDNTGTNTENIECGMFTVTEPESYGDTVILTAADDMYRADRPFSTNLTFPVTAAVLFNDICTSIGVIPESLSFLNNGFEIAEAPSSELTFRQVIGYIAMIAAGNAKINRNGKLEIMSYDFDFTGTHHELSAFKSLRTGLDDVVITGVRTEIDKETEAMSGTAGYVLSLENPLWKGHEATAMTLIGARMIGGRFRDFTGDHVAYPLAEFMDKAVLIDRRGRTYNTIITDVDFTFGGFTVLKNSAETPARNSSIYNSASTQTLIRAQELVIEERTQREAAIQNLANSLAHSNGLYMTTEAAQGGGTIYYLHDKPTLAESETVLKVNAEGIGISQDGGGTYSVGIDFSGNAILNKIYTIGIDAQYIHIGNKTLSQELTDTYSTKTETSQQINAGLGSLSSTISQTYTTKQEFNNLEIGGENLVRGTGDFRNAAMSASLTLVDATEDEENIKCCNFPAASTLAWLYFAFKPRIPFSLVRGKKVTLSFWYRSDSWSTASGEQARPVPAFELFKDQTSSRYMWYSIYDGTIPVPTTTWQRVVRTYTLDDSVFTSGSGTIENNDYFTISIFRYNNSHMQVKKVKLEFGDKATDWSPAPADLTVRLTSAESSITQNATQIALKVSQTDYDAQHIVDKINASSLTINPNNISLSGKTIDLYTENIRITSGMQSISDTTHDGAYFGNDGIAFGRANVWIGSTGAFKFGAIRSSGSSSENAWVTNALLVSYGCEIYAGNQNSEPYIDMHRDVDSPQDTTSYDYTARISNSSDNVVSIFGKRSRNAQQADPCTVVAGAFSQGSDRRLKNTIAPLDSAKSLAFIKALKPSSFFYNGTDGHHHGFIHDEVDSEKYDRDWAVTEMIQNLLNDGVTYGTVNTLEIVPDIVAVLQSLLKDNEMLKQQVAALQSA